MATPIRFITLAFLILSVTLLSSSLNVVAEKETQRTEAEVRLMYERWLVENQKNYNALGEKERRFEIFKDSLNFIDQHNSVPDRTYEVGLTPFADLTNEEFRAIYLSKKMERPSYSVKAERYMFKEGDDLPDEVDWREKGAVVPIKNQGKCGSCWAFSAIGAVEGINQIKTGELVSLSEQELMDCDRGVVNAGCDGGIMNYAFEFIVEKGGVESEQDYPYTAQDLMVCHATKNNTRVVTIDGYEVVPQNDELSLKKAVAHQPISVSIEAYNEAFKLYKSGVFTGKCGTFLDHGVIVVGYGSSDGEDYWIIRNSWGEKWGEGGYARLQRNFNETTGKCGVAIMPSYPIKKPVSSADLLTDI